MNLKIIKPGNIYIIGNSPEKEMIANHITPRDIIIRFNKPNPSCSIKADILFIANGQYRITHLEDTSTILVNNKYQIIWRYQPFNMILGRYEKLSLFRKIKYLLYFQYYKSKNYPDKPQEFYIPIESYQKCIEWLKGSKPSTGILAIHTLLNLYPEKKIFLHNFTFEGTQAHNWKLEKELITTLVNNKKLFMI